MPAPKGNKNAARGRHTPGPRITSVSLKHHRFERLRSAMMIADAGGGRPRDEEVIALSRALYYQAVDAYIEQRMKGKTMNEVTYTEWKTLQTRGAVDPGPDQPVQGTLLVGTEAALRYYDNQSSYGEDLVKIFPAFHDGKRCWVKREDWSPARGYSASGTQEVIIPFEEGVKIFLERGVFEFPTPKR